MAKIISESNGFDVDEPTDKKISEQNCTITCPNCGHQIQYHDEQGVFHELPAGVKFDPSDQEILEHLEGKVRFDTNKNHPLIDQFIPTLDGENGICCTHPEKLPGVSRDGIIRHFFHCPSKAYTTGTRKRRKVDAATQTRWHKTGKTRPILVGGEVKGYKKILVLYTNHGAEGKPRKTNWVMHQYHLGSNEDEKDGEMVVSKVFYQTQPRQCSSGAKESNSPDGQSTPTLMENSCRSCASHISYDQEGGLARAGFPELIIPNFFLNSSANGSSFLP